MNKPEYHIHHRFDGSWLALKEDTRVAVRARTFEEVVDRTIELARRWHADVLLHRKNGDVEPLHISR